MPFCNPSGYGLLPVPGRATKRERGQACEQRHMVSEPGTAGRGDRHGVLGGTCWLVLLALEPGVEVDIGTTCGSPGRPLTGRDRSRLWRKVHQWEAFQSWKAVAWNLRDQGGQNRRKAVVCEVDRRAMEPADGAANGALNEEIIGWTRSPTPHTGSGRTGGREGGEADRESDGKAAEWADGAAKQTEHGEGVTRSRNPAWQERELDGNAKVAEVPGRNGDAARRPGPGKEGAEAGGVASGGEAGWEVATVERELTLTMAEEVPGRAREAMPHGEVGDVGERERHAEGEPGHAPRAWRGTLEAATGTAGGGPEGRAHCGGHVRGRLDGGKPGETLKGHAGYAATTARATAQVAAQGESCEELRGTRGGGDPWTANSDDERREGTAAVRTGPETAWTAVQGAA